MFVIKFRSSGEHANLLKKVKKMKEFTEDLEECLEAAMEEEDYGYRKGSYRKEWEDEDEMKNSRYNYRGGMR